MPSTALSGVHQSLLVQRHIIWLIVPSVCLRCQTDAAAAAAAAAADKPAQVATRDLPVKVHSQVPVWGEEALVQVVHLVVVLHQQLQARLVTTGRTHGLATQQQQQHMNILPFPSDRRRTIILFQSFYEKHIY